MGRGCRLRSDVPGWAVSGSQRCCHLRVAFLTHNMGEEDNPPSWDVEALA